MEEQTYRTYGGMGLEVINERTKQMSEAVLERKFKEMEEVYGANWWDSTDISERA